MKNKPQKPDKLSKKKEPEPVVELTPKQQREKRREEARARAAETRKIVTAGTGQWTGKLPAQLLNEHAQLMKWERVEYPAKDFGRNSDQEKWVASVILGRKNPKTKVVERIRFDPPSDLIEKQPTQLEARHFAATYGMHRVLSHRNLKMMLPPLHRDLWIKLDEIKANAKPHEKYNWNDDPWQAEADRKASRQKFEEEQKARAERRTQNEIAREASADAPAKQTHKEENKEGSSQDTMDTTVQPSGTKRIMFNNTLEMSRKARSVVESVIRDNNGFRFSTKDALDKSDEPERYTKIMTMLQKLGFREAYAEEALEYSSSLGAALTWLLIHVPEDDVPASFMPTNIGATARVSSNIKVENTTSRLREFGYSEDIARTVAAKFDGSLGESVIHLSSAFAHTASLEQQSAEGDNEMWSEEVESLRAMFEPNQIVNADTETVTVNLPRIGIQISLFKPKKYPLTIPGIAVEPLQAKKISKLTQLGITRQAVVFASTNFVGDYMMMMLIQHIEEFVPQVIKIPAKLSQISSGVSGIDEYERFKDIAEKQSQADRDLKARRAYSFDPKRVIEDRDARMSTQKGKEILSNRATLPAWEKRDEIAKLAASHQVVLITGETGSGKSTQTVQFILDSTPDAHIICTQPRRISAIGVAQRVADERCVEIGDQVGYVIRGEAKMSRKTQLKFVTSGVLLRMLQRDSQIASSDDDTLLDPTSDELASSSGLKGVTHIVVDEAHERSLDGDFLLILLKRLLSKSSQIKIILMSATVDPKQFSDYFKPLQVGYTHITGRTFPVKQFFLDDVITATGYRPKSLKGSKSEEDAEESTEDLSVGKIIGAIRTSSPGRVDYQLVATTVAYIHQRLLREGDSNGSILVFMSGAGEIDEALRAIQSTSNSSSFWALPLHASLPPSDQQKVFQKAPSGLRKVIASTNVAETSITISDIVAVIDTGRVKETIYDTELNVSRLVDSWTSQSSATQRMGRAGRVRAGECFKLYTENTQQTNMPVRPLPEILRSPLEFLYLNVKAMGISNVEKFLSMAIDPPKQTALDSAKLNLMSYGALNACNELTSLGKHISMIPTDPRMAKLLVLGTMMGCLPSCLTAAAVSSMGKLPFITKRNENEHNADVFETFGGKSGDLIAACHAFDSWESGSFDRNKINVNVCRDIRSTRRQLLGSLVQIGFVDASCGIKGRMPDQLSRYDGDEATVRAVISASLQPNLVEIVFPQQKFLSTSEGAVLQKGVEDSRQIKYFTSKGDRVFTHPRSLLFGAREFVDGARYASYSSTVLTSKYFIAEITPVSPCGLSLFAGRIDVDPLGNGVVVDKWTGLKCWPRAGILLQFLQQLFSRLMEKKFHDPKENLIDHPVIKLVHDLIESDGKSQPVGLIA